MESNNERDVSEKVGYSVVIPVYNRAHTIQRAIESVLKQIYENFEIIVVDDGSTDNTKEIVLSIQDERIRYIYQENQGAQVARNKGLHLACGEYISFLDSDDEWLPTFLSKVIEKFSQDPTIGCVYCLVGSKDKNGIVHASPQSTIQGDIYRLALEQGYITAPSMLAMRRSCFEVVGDWDIRFPACQDDDMCFRLAKEFRFAVILEPLSILYMNYEGSDNRIGASANRVATGWWILWNKYQEDVVIYCGKRTMANHYLKCANSFVRANNSEMRDKALSRALSFFDFNEEFHRLLERVSKGRLYCYGAGEYAKNIGRFLLKNNYKIEAFLVTDGNSNEHTLFGIPVNYLSELKDIDGIVVLVSTDKKYHAEIKDTLVKRQIINIHTIPDDLYLWMCLDVN